MSSLREMHILHSWSRMVRGMQLRLDCLVNLHPYRTAALAARADPCPGIVPCVCCCRATVPSDGLMKGRETAGRYHCQACGPSAGPPNTLSLQGPRDRCRTNEMRLGESRLCAHGGNRPWLSGRLSFSAEKAYQNQKSSAGFSRPSHWILRFIAFSLSPQLLKNNL
jgi:hypothetical protein